MSAVHGFGRGAESIPHARLLSNGRYTVLLTAAGTGCSLWRGLALTGWAADPTLDADGIFVYLRDLGDGRFWSLGAQPCRTPGASAARALPGRVTIARRAHGIAATLDVAVPPGADAEVRRVRLHNLSARPRRLEVTTYTEVVLAERGMHVAHPAFAKLFVETEWVAAARALLAHRRPRRAEEPPAWMAAVLAGPGRLGFETDRARFLGRGGSPAAPRALLVRAPLLGAVGPVLDPVLALRRVIRLEPHEAVELVFVLAAAETRAAALALARSPVQAFAQAEHAERGLWKRLGLGAADAAALDAVAGAVLYAAPHLPAAAQARARALGPDVAAAYWQAKGLDPTRLGRALADRRPEPAASTPRARRRWRPAATPTAPRAFAPGKSGFGARGREYVLHLDPPARPPMPWVNVIAAEAFGCLVSEAGAGCTWSRNSRLDRLTPWSNDPVADPHGEALWIRDEDGGTFWSPLPGPTPAAAPYEVRHGLGCSRWRHASHGLAQETCLFVPRGDPVKVIEVTLRNTAHRPRQLSLFAYFHLVLGALPEETRGHVRTAFDRRVGLLFADDPRRPGAVAFAAAAAPPGARLAVTGDRTAFLGHRGTPACPAALATAARLDGRTGRGLDPCAALQLTFRLGPGETVACTILLGEAASRRAARRLVARYRTPGATRRALEAVRAFWDETVDAVQIATPVPAIDVLVNSWLPYQTLACRLWGRSAFYQSGGAFGFRDQLQDAAALVYHRPDLARAQLLLHAAHQFPEGDVLHWWHPGGRGTRTRVSDDLAWLPYLTAHYVRTTGDWAILDERIGFVAARPLADGEDEAYLACAPTRTRADLYEHCCRALDRALTRGAHGLPLIGTGDWNDGMNRVGRAGRGESVWLGFFLYAVLGDFLPLCRRRGDRARAARYRAWRRRLRDALARAGWDGAWYRRAYYDDGTPLGSAQSDECRIDALVQAWAVLSAAAPPARAARAMDAVERRLVSARDGLVRLLAPPFDRGRHDPGYIKGYVPGIRENGGQYTHAALWVVAALARLGRRERAAALLERIGPVWHTRNAAVLAVYRVEPYVVAADIYGAPPHVGRGGWTWYTGSAGWMLRVALEEILGLRLEEGRWLCLRPAIPDAWPGFTVSLRLPDGRTRYTIAVANPRRRARRVLTAHADGLPAAVTAGAARVPLRADGGLHRVRVVLGA